MKLPVVLTLIRPRQWVKNVFVFAPIFFSPTLSRESALADVTLMFIAFCLVASGIYCFNDYWDRTSDTSSPEEEASARRRRRRFPGIRTHLICRSFGRRELRLHLL